jgi:hypothetical protein
MNIGAWGRAILWFVAGIVIAGLGWLSVRELARSKPVVMRSYEVRPEIARDLGEALGEALRPYHVSIGPDGHYLLVSAPEAMQAGVAVAIKQADETPAEQTPSVTFDLWLVSAAPGRSAADPALTEIQPALAAIEKNKGQVHFQLLEKLSAVARPGGDVSRVVGSFARMQLKPPSIRHTSDGKVTVAADIGVVLMPSADFHAMGQVEASVDLIPGNLLVIGQSSLATDKIPKNTQLYYIVRATI